MDPLQALKDILLSAQRIGQPATLETLLFELEEISENAALLSEWYQKGGFKPELYVTIDGLD